jgi:hypothetical protein
MTRPLNQFDKDLRCVFRKQISGLEFHLTFAPFRGAAEMRRAALQQMQQRFLTKRRRDGFHVFNEGRAAGLSLDTVTKIVSDVIQCHPPARVENASINLAADEPQRRVAHAIKEYRALKSQGSYCPPERLLQALEKVQEIHLQYLLAIDAPAA